MVAVLEIHIDRNMVVIMKPSISLAWLVPTSIMILRATLADIYSWCCYRTRPHLLCRPLCSTAIAIMSPPKNM